MHATTVAGIEHLVGLASQRHQALVRRTTSTGQRASRRASLGRLLQPHLDGFIASLPGVRWDGHLVSDLVTVQHPETHSLTIELRSPRCQSTAERFLSVMTSLSFTNPEQDGWMIVWGRGHLTDGPIVGSHLSGRRYATDATDLIVHLSEAIWNLSDQAALASAAGPAIAA